MREGNYNFTIVVPTPNTGGGLQSAKIDGVLEVRALASLVQSDISFSHSTAKNDVVLRPQESVHLHITARDIDGYIIDRGGEQIIVAVQQDDGSEESDEFLASFNDETGRYEADVKSLDTVGKYFVGLKGDNGTIVNKDIWFRVECACMQVCPPPRQCAF